MKNEDFKTLKDKYKSRLIIILIIDEECQFCIEYLNLTKNLLKDDKYRKRTYLIQIDQFDQPFDEFSELIRNKVPSLLFILDDKIVYKCIGVLNRKSFIEKLDQYCPASP